MEQFLGMLVQMGVIKYPQYRMYWSPSKCAPEIADVMPLQRFENYFFTWMRILKCQNVVMKAITNFIRSIHY